MENIKNCDDLRKIIDFRCCSSCHSEWDEYDSDPSEIIYKNEIYHVCCSGVVAIENLIKKVNNGKL
jgi:hypothetical protein